MKYLFTFTPTGSFMFSGESSIASPQRSDFLASDPFSAKRESFIVTSDKMPPQTTVMGAIRYLLLQWKSLSAGTSEADKLIGESTFSLSNPQDKMGIIKSIGPVMLTGKNSSDRRVFLMPAPVDQKCPEKGEDHVYQPMEEFNPKANECRGFLSWHEEANGSLKYDGWYSEENLFATYVQALHATMEDGNQKDNQSYHMQERVRLIDRHLSEKGIISEPAFCVEVELLEELSGFTGMFVSLGGRESTFKVHVEKFDISFAEKGDTENSVKFYLLSPAYLPENWRDAPGLQMAYLNTRRLRGAVTRIDKGNVSMKLNADRLIFADAGSVFIFNNNDNMEKFRRSIEEDKRILCGFNRTAAL